jgi:hypothetical protein
VIEKYGGASRDRTDDLIVANDGVLRRLRTQRGFRHESRSKTVQFQACRKSCLTAISGPRCGFETHRGITSDVVDTKEKASNPSPWHWGMDSKPLIYSGSRSPRKRLATQCKHLDANFEEQYNARTENNGPLFCANSRQRSDFPERVSEAPGRVVEAQYVSAYGIRPRPNVMRQQCLKNRIYVAHELEHQGACPVLGMTIVAEPVPSTNRKTFTTAPRSFASLNGFKGGPKSVVGVTADAVLLSPESY